MQPILPDSGEDLCRLASCSAVVLPVTIMSSMKYNILGMLFNTRALAFCHNAGAVVMPNRRLLTK